MTSPLSAIAHAALAGSLMVVWPLASGCAHSPKAASMQGGAPILLPDDAPHARGGANPNAPYLVAATGPQLVKRSPSTDAATVNPCDSKDLSVTEIAAAVNGDYRVLKLAFDNQGLVPCRLGGYPGISLLDQKGTPVADIDVQHVSASSLQAEVNPGEPMQAFSKADAQITLSPRDEAWFQVAWKTGQGCPVVSRISVSAPGATQNFTINHPLSICKGRLEVTTLHSDQD